MAASPVDLTSDMQAIEAHWQEGQRLHGAGVFTDEEWSQHQAISYTENRAGTGRNEAAR